VNWRSVLIPSRRRLVKVVENTSYQGLGAGPNLRSRALTSQASGAGRYSLIACSTWNHLWSSCCSLTSLLAWTKRRKPRDVFPARRTASQGTASGPVYVLCRRVQPRRVSTFATMACFHAWNGFLSPRVRLVSYVQQAISRELLRLEPCMAETLRPLGDN